MLTLAESSEVVSSMMGVLKLCGGAAFWSASPMAPHERINIRRVGGI
jgi:hypothetical protein